MFDKELEKYTSKGQFTFKQSETYQTKCNAPTDKSGVYLIYKIINSTETLIYIGSSGQKDEAGNLKHRKGGMKDRLVNGYHPNRFGQLKRIKRSKAFPLQMLTENIPEIKVYWWVTLDEQNSDFPTDVETLLREKYIEKHERLPDWHQQK
jgi:hypothetical protein